MSKTCARSATPWTTWSPSWERAETVEEPAVRDDGRDAGAVAGGVPLAARLGWEFGDVALLTQALSHRSWCAEAGGTPSNERLEFLGDAVLGLVVAEHSYLAYPDLPEGSLAKMRAAVVNTAVLADVAAELDLGPELLLGRGEDASGGRRKSSILANAVEAVIGAVYLDGGWEAATGLVLRLLGDRIAEAAAGPGSDDFKTRLQELVLHRSGQLPRYEVEGTGPDHARRYRARLFVAGRDLGSGEGRSKKDAEQAAARVAMQTLAAAPSPTAQSPTTQSPTAQSPTAQSPTAQSPTAQSPTEGDPAAWRGEPPGEEAVTGGVAGA